MCCCSSERAFESLQRRVSGAEDTDFLARRLSSLEQSGRILEALAGSPRADDDEEKRGGSGSGRGRQGTAASTATTTLTPALCRFFVLGKCRYGSHCTFSHALPPQASECAENEADGLSVAAAMVDCPFFLRGNCKYGDYCRLRHNAASPSTTLGGRPYVAAAGRASTAFPPPNSSTGTSNGAENQQEFTCGICFEDIVESGKHFGLLSESPAVSTDSKDLEVEVIRACPACRLPSNYIVPSLTFCTGDAKRQVVAAYKGHLALRECKYFNGHLGSCPFGQHCFYAHRDSEGQDVKHLDRPKRSTKARRRGHTDEAALQLLQQYSHLFRFLETGDWDDFADLVDENDAFDQESDEDEDEDEYGYDFYDDDDDDEYDTE
ncbi:hypothetical protein BBJ28_00012435 [Nothophytophthora sp. Chile5]|nr:hypothetical protein BBJ28_00012435 [Nothophytophthora sp. Chile5]